MQFLSNRLGFIRFYTWWNYKLPPLFGIAFLFILHTQLSFGDSLKRLGILIVCMIGTAGFGNYLNDLFDSETDRLAGKSNSAASHSGLRRAVTIGVLLAMALLPWFIFYEVGIIHGLTVAMLLLFVLYSAPPVRLKDRGLLGIVCDTLYAHAIPALVVALAVTEGFAITQQTQWLMLIVFLWQFFAGLRNIAFHQFEDYRQDKLAGANTWAVKIGEERIKKICLYWIHPAEMLLFLIFAATVFYVTLPGGIILLLLIALRLYIYVFMYEKGYLSNWKNYFSFVNNSYEEDIPLVMLICLTLTNPMFIVLLVLYCILFPEYFLRMQRL